MHLVVIAVGKLKNPQWRALAEEYSKRIRRQAKLEMVELRDADPEKEGERLLAALENYKGSPCYILSEEGRTGTSPQLASKLYANLSETSIFVIGGSYGLVDSVKSAGELFSLSPMTFPHEMARVILLEQLYRALSINSGSGYHH